MQAKKKETEITQEEGAVKIKTKMLSLLQDKGKKKMESGSLGNMGKKGYDGQTWSSQCSLLSACQARSNFGDLGWKEGSGSQRYTYPFMHHTVSISGHKFCAHL